VDHQQREQHMRVDIEQTVWTINKIESLKNGDEVSEAFKRASENEIALLTIELCQYSVSELVDFIVNFEGF
jgi:hypothetical protein